MVLQLSYFCILKNITIIFEINELVMLAMNMVLLLVIVWMKYLASYINMKEKRVLLNLIQFIQYKGKLTTSDQLTKVTSLQYIAQLFTHYTHRKMKVSWLINGRLRKWNGPTLLSHSKYGGTTFIQVTFKNFRCFIIECCWELQYPKFTELTTVCSKITNN